MKTITILLMAFCSMVAFGQTAHDGDILITKTQQDDT